MLIVNKDRNGIINIANITKSNKCSQGNRNRQAEWCI